MLSPLRNRFGIPGVISVIALVFAMLGGAYAASNDGGSSPKASASAKAKQGPRGPRGKTGPAGPAGPAGPQGPAGAAGAKGDKGDTGAQGATGAPGAAGATGSAGAAGANGKTILSGTATPTVGVGAIGDFYIETDESKIYGPKAASGANGGWGTGTDLKGEKGDPWSVGGTLPPGETETGTWAATITVEGLTPLTYPIPLSAEIGIANVVIFESATAPQKENCEDSGHAGSAGAGNPEAKPGYLCVYTAAFFDDGEINGVYKSSEFQEGSGNAGAVLYLKATATDSGLGTFAVTAPTTP